VAFFDVISLIDRVNVTHAQSSSSAATPTATIAPVSATKSTSANVPAQVSGSESRASNVAHPSSHESRSAYEQATHTSKPSLETPVVNLPEPQSTLLTHTHGFSSPTPAGEQIIFAPPGPSNLQPTLNRDGTSQSLEQLAKVYISSQEHTPQLMLHVDPQPRCNA
jgi:hypothetical protein